MEKEIMRKYDNRTNEANIHYNISKETVVCKEIAEPNRKKIGAMDQKLEANKWSQSSKIGNDTKMVGQDHNLMNNNNETKGQMEPNAKYDKGKHQEKRNWLAEGTCQVRFCERVQKCGTLNTRKHRGTKCYFLKNNNQKLLIPTM